MACSEIGVILSSVRLSVTLIRSNLKTNSYGPICW